MNERCFYTFLSPGFHSSTVKPFYFGFPRKISVTQSFSGLSAITTFFAEFTGPKKLEKVNHNRQQIRYLLRGYVYIYYDMIWYDMNIVTEYKRNMYYIYIYTHICTEFKYIFTINSIMIVQCKHMIWPFENIWMKRSEARARADGEQQICRVEWFPEMVNTTSYYGNLGKTWQTSRLRSFSLQR